MRKGKEIPNHRNLLIPEPLFGGPFSSSVKSRHRSFEKLHAQTAIKAKEIQS